MKESVHAFGRVLLLWLTACPVFAAEPVLELHAGTTIHSLARVTAYHHDAGGRAPLPEIEQLAGIPAFAPLPDGDASFGFQPGAYWFHARIRNQNSDEPRWLLVQQYALSDRIDIYLRYPDGRVLREQGGDHLPFAQRSVRYRHPNFQIDLPAGQTVDLYVRVESQSSMQVPLALYTPTAFAELSRDAQFAMGVYYGILLALFTYNLVLWLTLRDSSYFWYLFHISAFGLVLFILYGLGFEYLWPDSAWLADRSVPLSICLAQIGMQQFARKFLGLRERWRAGDRVGLGLIVLFLLLGIASTQIGIRTSTQLTVVAVIISVAWIAVEAVVAVRRNYKPAKLFLVAWSMFLAGIAMVAMVAFGVLPKNFVTEYSVQMGSALEMLLLSVALGYRYASLRNENERIVRESRDQLEVKVEQRTAELRSALGQLEAAHLRLREFSRLDGLTELYNRAHFREAFEHLLSQASHSQRPISLLMIDLDYFKRINDTYGHLVGDDCLRWTSNTLAETLRPYGALVARFGGEEFIAALPDMDLDEASAVAEELRQRLRDRPCRSGDLDIPISASIGVHCVDTAGKNSIDAALQVADLALYAAKAEGRDCVRTL